MTRLLLAIALTCYLNSAIAQTGNQAESTTTQLAGVTISGIIKDSAANQVLEFSSVMLIKKGEQASDGINSDSLGHFAFHQVQPGEYTLSVFYVGYPKLERTIVVDASGKDISLGVVNMNTGNTALKEVQIVDYRQLVEQRPDGMVYNAEKDITNKGITADQLLRKVPMVTVDLEGNVQLRGSRNIKVLIDGKPSTLIASSVKDALRQIPADNIKSVEVITSPGARYDAEGAAGVINIITKKSLMKGLSGSVFGALSYNVPQQLLTGHGGFNLNYRNKNFGLGLNAGASRWEMVIDMMSERTDFPRTNSQATLIQNTVFNGGGNFYWSRLNADYQIDSLQSIQAGISYNPGNWTQNTRLFNHFMPVDTADSRRNTYSESPRDNIGFDAAYSLKFKNNPKRTLDILSQYSINSTTQKYELDGHSMTDDAINYRERNTNKSHNNEFTIQADYVHPLKKPGQKIETGLKYINRDISSEYQLEFWTPNATDFAVDPRRTNRLAYTQQVGAAYAQFATPLSKRLSMIAGARYEFTDIKGHQQEAGSAFKTQFNNLLPNLSFAYGLSDYSKLKLSYNMRIERPSIDYVNPYINYSDRYNLTQGNPLLVPEKTHNVELGYSTFFGSTSLNFSSFYRHTGNGIENVTSVGSDNVSRTTYQNVAKNNTVGLDFYGSSNFFNRWMINLNGSLYYKSLKSPSLNIENSGWQYTASMYTSFKLSERFSIAGYAMYNGNQIQLQGYQTTWYYYFLGLQVTVLKGKGTLNLAGENFFTPEVHMTTKYQYQNADYEMHSTYYGRGVRLSFQLNFGKMHFMQQKKVDNKDLKSGNNGQQTMGGQ
ncbi:TonB-dependent receptor [Taibaiella helva]|uniref:TonB-dependent receptor n=1 Tax=Taibaiella helva TaxID=2301235 RepID=UPI000E571A67|nr:TonB-dependent receptor [Taibaiella helva]